MSTLRNVLILDYMRTSDPQTILRLASEYSDNFSIVTLMADVLNSLVTENYEAQLFPLLQVLLTYTEEDRRETIDEYNRVWKIIEKNKASIGMLQRVFKIGFNRAARIMDQLTEAGVVSEENGTKARTVLMDMPTFEQYLEDM